MVSVSKEDDIFVVLLSKVKLAETGMKKKGRGYFNSKIAALKRYDRFATNVSMFLKKL